MSVITTTIRMEDSQFFSAINKMEGRLSALAGNFAGLAAKMAAAFAPIAAGITGVSAAMVGMQRAMRTEDLTVAFSVLTGSVESARKAVADLSEFADESPFPEESIVNAGRQLMAFGFQANAIKDILRDLGDTAAAMQVPIDAVADTFGRLKAGQFGQAFMNLRRMGITREDLEGRGLRFDASGSYVGSVEQAMEAVRRVMQDKFGGTMRELSMTTSSQWLGLKERLAKVMETIFEPLSRALGPIFEKASNHVRDVMLPAARELAAKIDRAIQGLRTTLADGRMGELLGLSLELGFMKAMNALAAGLETVLATTGAAFSEVFGNSGFWSGLLKTLLGIAGQFGAALFRAFEAPLAHVQAAMEQVFDWKNFRARGKAFEDASRWTSANAKDLFGGREVSGAVQAWMNPQRYVSLTSDEYYAARNKKMEELLRERGAVSVEERANRIMAEGGPRFGLSGAGMNASQIANEGAALVRDGAEEMKKPAADFLAAARLLAANFEPTALYDPDTLKALEDRLRSFFPKIEPTPPAETSGRGRGAAGGADSPAGGPLNIIADSLARIGGGGGVAGVNAALEEAREQTSELRAVNKNLEEVKRVLTTGHFTGGGFIQVERLA